MNNTTEMTMKNDTRYDETIQYDVDDDEEEEEGLDDDDVEEGDDDEEGNRVFLSFLQSAAHREPGGATLASFQQQQQQGQDDDEDNNDNNTNNDDDRHDRHRRRTKKVGKKKAKSASSLAAAFMNLAEPTETNAKTKSQDIYHNKNPKRPFFSKPPKLPLIRKRGKSTDADAADVAAAAPLLSPPRTQDHAIQTFMPSLPPLASFGVMMNDPLYQFYHDNMQQQHQQHPSSFAFALQQKQQQQQQAAVAAQQAAATAAINNRGLLHPFFFAHQHHHRPLISTNPNNNNKKNHATTNNAIEPQQQQQQRDEPIFFLSPAAMAMSNMQQMTMMMNNNHKTASMMMMMRDHYRQDDINMLNPSTGNDDDEVGNDEDGQGNGHHDDDDQDPSEQPQRHGVNKPNARAAAAFPATSTGKDAHQKKQKSLTTTTPVKTISQHPAFTKMTFGHPAIANTTTAATTAASTMTDATAAPVPNAVYFGWIRHPATRTWRDVVKRFSQNRKQYPSWSDDVYYNMKTVMKEEKGIDQYFIFQRQPQQQHLAQQQQQDMSTTTMSSTERKKIFDKNKQNLGAWRPATYQEIMDRTKQRFIDDRKPHQVVVGVKRPRGRPPKAVSREASLDMALLMTDNTTQSTMSSIFTTLQQVLLKSREEMQRLAAYGKHENNVSNNNATVEEGGNSSKIDPAKALLYIDPAQLINVMRDLEQAQLWIRKRLEDTLKIDVDVSKCSVVTDETTSTSTTTSNSSSNTTHGDTDGDDHPTTVSLLNHHQSASNKKTKWVDGNSVSARKPWFPVMSNQVCFGWNHHPGTIQWLDAIKSLADNRNEFPEWNPKVADIIKETLARENDCTVFLVFLDSHCKPSPSIHDGLWYLATDEELMEKTHAQFLHYRQQQQHHPVITTTTAPLLE